MASSPPPSKRRRKNQIEDVPNDASVQKKSPLIIFAHDATLFVTVAVFFWLENRESIVELWKEMIGKALHAVDVVTFDYPYFSGGKKGPPPKAEKLVEYHLRIVKDAIAKYPGHPLILAGKSLGSRVSCMVAAQEDIDISAIICLGYPLKGANEAVRIETLLQLTVPTMFVQGSKDALCSLDKLAAVRKKMKFVNELHVVDGGDHYLKIGKKHLESKGTTQEEADDQAVKAVSVFVMKVLGES
ncbi:KAT8 regulatory NSL complex subunit 3/Testis-expressed sequence 30 protein [Macleaya cordata]|uniref:KAT8 regulatory NSL complex subunit 3/Testis-expressed sequence 30 protein n=1 Tax=Macleaya cordata TaxID=56857 RepID=A0A200QLX1_MACCD|nr:KAT8 regulatory NSL complex subunit 3/Testis-expressed sequence 30 protein [Macleaya cordata]